MKGTPMSDSEIHFTSRPSKSGRYLSTEDWDALKATGYTEQELLDDQPYGPMIFSYTRAQAIEDGVLIDVTDLALQAGLRLHTVITCGVAAELAPSHGGPAVRDEVIRDILHAFRQAIQNDLAAGKNTDRADFTVNGVELYALIGPGDDAEPVLTVMLIGED